MFKISNNMWIPNTQCKCGKVLGYMFGDTAVDPFMEPRPVIVDLESSMATISRIHVCEHCQKCPYEFDMMLRDWLTDGVSLAIKDRGVSFSFVCPVCCWRQNVWLPLRSDLGKARFSVVCDGCNHTITVCNGKIQRTDAKQKELLR